jgi:hypothetical protein
MYRNTDSPVSAEKLPTVTPAMNGKTVTAKTIGTVAEQTHDAIRLYEGQIAEPIQNNTDVKGQEQVSNQWDD